MYFLAVFRLPNLACLYGVCPAVLPVGLRVCLVCLTVMSVCLVCLRTRDGLVPSGTRTLVVAVSVTGNAGIGMPIILLHDAEGGIVTVELKNGEVCRGLLDEAEDSMNLVLKVREP